MLAQLIARELAARGIKHIFVDTRVTDGAGPFPERLLRAIEACRVFVCLLADTTFDSAWVQREIEHAHDLGKPMIPIFQESYVPTEEPPTPAIAALLQSDGVHVFDIKNIYVDQTMDDLATMIKKTLASSRPPHPGIRWTIGTALAVLLLIAAVGVGGALRQTAAPTPTTALPTTAVAVNPTITASSLPTVTTLSATDVGNTVQATTLWTPTPTATFAPGTVRTDANGVTQVYVPAGCFMMGSDPAKDKVARPEEQPQHEVCITRSYWIDAYEVTDADYQKFIDDGGYSNPAYWSADGWQWKRSNDVTGPKNDSGFTSLQQPRVGVSWYEADAYARWRGGRLPSEAEWEYAARGPSSSIYPWGDTWDGSRLNAENGLGQTSVVGSYPASKNWIGAYDLAGNALEWVNDWYDGNYYQQKDKNDPSGPASGQHHVLRGGSWRHSSDFARAAARISDLPGLRDATDGFRVVGGFGVTPFASIAANSRWTPQFQTFGGVEMALVPPGCFTMGTENPPLPDFDNQKPVTRVCFDKPFWIDKYLVTNGQFKQLGGKAQNQSSWAGDNRPRDSITWFEARDFCAIRGARLPTEAEWEYAARGPDSLVYPWGNSFDANAAVHIDNSGAQTADVGSKPGGASWVGALDMSGNVWQWVNTLYTDYPYDASDGRESNENTVNGRVLRGGSWRHNEYFLPAATRTNYDPSLTVDDFGFRCARTSS